MLNVQIGGESGLDQETFGVLLIIVLLMGPVGIIVYVTLNYMIPYAIRRVQLWLHDDLGKQLLNGIELNNSTDASPASPAPEQRFIERDSSRSEAML